MWITLLAVPRSFGVRQGLHRGRLRGRLHMASILYYGSLFFGVVWRRRFLVKPAALRLLILRIRLGFGYVWSGYYYHYYCYYYFIGIHQAAPPFRPRSTVSMAGSLTNRLLVGIGPPCAPFGQQCVTSFWSAYSISFWCQLRCYVPATNSARFAWAQIVPMSAKFHIVPAAPIY